MGEELLLDIGEEPAMGIVAALAKMKASAEPLQDILMETDPNSRVIPHRRQSTHQVE